jgi:hypothetical protein
LTGGWQRDEQLLGFAAIVESVVGDA